MPGLDVTLVMAALARETSHVGLVTTASTTFNPPYVIARQMQTLHWLSNGRAGWNIVTSIEGAENFGSQPMPAPEERYRKAAEFTQAVRALWDSFPYEALTGEKSMAPAAHEGSSSLSPGRSTCRAIPPEARRCFRPARRTQDGPSPPRSPMPPLPQRPTWPPRWICGPI